MSLRTDGDLKLTARELARIIDVTEGTIRRWAAAYEHFPNPAEYRHRGKSVLRLWRLNEVNRWLLHERSVAVERMKDAAIGGSE